MLTTEQKQLSLEITRDMLDNANSDPKFLNTMITSIISEAKKSTTGPQQCQGHADRFDSRGVVHHEYTPQSTTITKEYYQEVLHRLCDSV
jgi:hypothetical protein